MSTCSAKSLLALVGVSAALTCSPVGLAYAGPSMPAQVSMKVSTRQIVMGERITLEATIRGEYDDIRPPQSEGFRFMQRGRSSQVSIVGSSITRSLVLTYVGVPTKMGTWRITPPEAMLEGTVAGRTMPISVKVVSARAALGPAVSAKRASELGRYSDEPFFVRPKLSRSKVFVGQPVLITYELHWAAGAGAQNIQEVSGPDFAGMTVNDLMQGIEAPQDRVRVGGRVYFRQQTKKVLLVGHKPGTVELVGPSYQVEAGDFFETRRFKVSPPVVKLQVLPIPTQGRPATYREDAIGQFELTARLSQGGSVSDKVSLETGERAVITLEVTGRGNLADLPRLSPAPVQALEFEPLAQRQDAGIRQGDSGPEGKRTWQYLVSALQPGTHTIAPVTFTAFNPDTGEFYSRTTRPLTVEAKGKPLAQAPAPVAPKRDAGVADEAPKPRPLDLRPSTPTLRLDTAADSHWTSASWFWPAAALPWLLWLLFWTLRRARGRWQAGASGRLRAEALSVAQAEVKGATHIGDVHGALLKFIQHRADLEVAGLTSAGVRRALLLHGVPSEAVDGFVDALTRCEHARFAPGGGEDELETLRQAAHSALLPLDAALGGKPERPAKRMKSLLPWALVLVSFSPNDALAINVDEAFQQANKLQLEGRYAEAEERYLSLLGQGLETSSLHFNLGNALAHHGKLGRALGHYRRALRLPAEGPLHADARFNASQVRTRLAEQSRRRHRVLHIFDETQELEVALGRAAPRGLLGILTLLFGALALTLWVRWSQGGRASLIALAGLAVTAHLVSAAWLWHSQRIERDVREGVVVQEDVELTPCVGVAEPLRLPEGLEVRVMQTRPDGRVEVRLRNGRRGCLPPEALYQS